jgi:large subunit ribosomal protein L5
MADETKKEKKSKGAKTTQDSSSAESTEKRQATVTRPDLPRLLVRYREEVVPALIKKFNYTNVMQVPRLLKISINKGIGRATDSAKTIESATMELTRISGQKPVVTRAKKSIAGFKLREGMPVGCRVTLRKRQMYEFLDRLLNIALPRIRDFRGVNPDAFDGHGNYSLGLTEQLIFPEIKYDDVERISGFCISFNTTARTDEEARSLLEAMGMPFHK